MIRAYPEKIDPTNGGWVRPDMFHVRSTFIVVIEDAGTDKYENGWSKITLANNRVGYVPASPKDLQHWIETIYERKDK